MIENNQVSLFPAEELSEKEFLTVKEATVFLSLSLHSIYKLTHSRAFTLFKPGGKKIYLRREDLVEWLSKGKRSSSKSLASKSFNYFKTNL